jgi:hypothetical protein
MIPDMASWQPAPVEMIQHPLVARSSRAGPTTSECGSGSQRGIAVGVTAVPLAPGPPHVAKL